MEDIRAEVIALRALIVGEITDRAKLSNIPRARASAPFVIAREAIEAEDIDADLRNAALAALDVIKSRINVG